MQQLCIIVFALSPNTQKTRGVHKSSKQIPLWFYLVRKNVIYSRQRECYFQELEITLCPITFPLTASDSMMIDKTCKQVIPKLNVFDLQAVNANLLLVNNFTSVRIIRFVLTTCMCVCFESIHHVTYTSHNRLTIYNG